MQNKKIFNSAGVPRSNLVFPQAVIAGDLIFLSGTTGVDPQTGRMTGDGFEEQAMQVFANISTILEEAGSSLDNIVKTTIFMVSGMDPDFSIINRVYAHYFPENAPVRSAPQVMPFPGNILVSAECIALLP